MQDLPGTTSLRQSRPVSRRDALRYATAVFAHRDGAWTTDGRAVFNLEPAQAIQRFGDSLEPLPGV